MTSINRNSFEIVVVLCILCLPFVSCDCNQSVSGTILDKATQQPIDSVFLQKASRNTNHTYSDKIGYFKLSSISGGLRECPPMTVALTKKGYEIITVEIENSHHDTIYIEKIE